MISQPAVWPGFEHAHAHATVRLEVWHLPDGRVLLHNPGRGAQAWIEMLPEAVPWLLDQLHASKEREEHGQGDF